MRRVEERKAEKRDFVVFILLTMFILSAGVVLAANNTTEGENDYSPSIEYGCIESNTTDNTTAEDGSGNTSYDGTGGLIAYWSFDEDEVSADVTGRNDVSLVGSSGVSTTGVNGSGLRFDTDQWLRVPDGPSINPTDAMTISLWVRVHSLTDDFQAFVDKDYAEQWYLGTAHPNTGTMFRWHMRLGSGDAFSYTDQYEFELDRWYHLAMTYDAGTGNWSRYVDGELVGSDVASCSGSACDIGTSDAPLCIGYSCSYDRNPLNATLDDVRLYDTALPAEEIERLSSMTPVNGSDEDTATGGSGNVTEGENTTEDVPGNASDDDGMGQPETNGTMDNDTGEGTGVYHDIIVSGRVDASIEPGRAARREITVTNNGTVEEQLSVSVSESDIVTLGAFDDRVPVDGSVRVPVIVSVPADAVAGTHRVEVRVRAGGEHRIVPVSVRVSGQREQGRTMRVSPRVRRVDRAGENVSIEADVSVDGGQADGSTVQLTTRLVDREGTVVATKRQNVSVNGSDTVSVRFDEELPDGEYSVEVDASSVDGSNTSSTSFAVGSSDSVMSDVEDPGGWSLFDLVVVILGVVFVVGVSVYRFNALSVFMSPGGGTEDEIEHLESRLDRLFERKKVIERDYEQGEIGEEKHDRFMAYFEEKEEELMGRIDRLRRSGSEGEDG